MSSKKMLGMIAVVAIVTAVLLTVIALMYYSPEKTEVNNSAITIFDSPDDSLKWVEVTNENGSYVLEQQDGEYTISGIPKESLNADYVKMLVDETAHFEIIEIVENNSTDVSKYGLSDPSAVVKAELNSGGDGYILIIGDEEPISKNRFAMLEGDGRVFMLKGGRVVRFLADPRTFIDYLIVPYTAFASPLDGVRDLKISGRELEEPIIIEAVEDETDVREALGFGAATHLIKSPVLHELDQGYGVPLTASLTGLLSERVEAYNCTDEELAEYGFDDPLYIYEFELLRNKDVQKEDVTLKIVNHDGKFLLTKNDGRIVYEISPNESITNIDYTKMPLRWFLTPLIIDITDVRLTIGEKEYNFHLSGSSNSDLKVTLNGEEISIESFRKFYSLLISAEHDGNYIGPDEANSEIGQELAVVEFKYKDTQKTTDTMTFYGGDMRRVGVDVNGTKEFTMSEKYVETLGIAITALADGKDFSAIW